MAGLLGLAAPALAQPASVDKVLFTADQLDYDSQNKVVTAHGKVEVFHQGRVLLADQIQYDQTRNKIHATGSVSLMEPNGDVIFAENLEITDDFKNGIIENVRLLMSDDSRMAAASATRIDGTRKELNYAVFSPCELCATDDGTKEPLWQLRAAKVIHDEESKDIIYHDAVMDFWGLPVFYTPYLSHTSPEVERRTGFLTPSIKQSTQLGFTVGVPYYYSASPSEDITVEPRYMAEEGFLLANHYRRRFDTGEMDIQTSWAEVDKRANASAGEDENTTRGHIEATGRFDVDDVWRWGFDVFAASDRTYLNRYGFSGIDFLHNEVFLEGFDHRNYASVRGLAFQGLRQTDDQDRIPYILPQFSYNYLSDPLADGSLFSFDASVLNLARQQGAKSSRISLKGGWEKSITTDFGSVYSLEASTQGDLYHVSDVPTDTSETQDGFTGRIFPQLAMKWEYPMVRSVGTIHQVIEPMVGMVLSPSGGNPTKIPNEDSQAFELDELNLFDPQRFAGFDRVAGDQRIDYGVNMGMHGFYGGDINMFIGQSVRLKEDSTYSTGTGHEGQFSDVVGNFQFSPSELIDILYRTRFDNDDAAFRRSEWGFRLGDEDLSFAGDYIFVDRLAGSGEFPDREEVSATFLSKIAEFWKFRAYGRRNLNDEDSNRFIGTGFLYQDDCFDFAVGIDRDFTDDGETAAATTFFVQFHLKHLGGYGVGSAFDE